MQGVLTPIKWEHCSSLIKLNRLNFNVIVRQKNIPNI